MESGTDLGGEAYIVASPDGSSYVSATPASATASDGPSRSS